MEEDKNYKIRLNGKKEIMYISEVHRGDKTQKKIFFFHRILQKVKHKKLKMVS